MPGISAGSSRTLRRSSGLSSSAFIPLENVAFVESLPATIRRMNPMTISQSVSFSPSMSACT